MNKKIRWIAAACLLAGSAVLFYYPVKERITIADQKKTAEAYKTALREDGLDDADRYEQLYEEIQVYNTSIYADGQTGLQDAWSYEQPPFELGHYGMESDVFAVLTIPAMEMELPVYLGASPDHLAKGAAVLGQTSIPIGQENSNSVIAAHRGYPGNPMFRDIELLSVGDQVRLEHPWGAQAYEVCEMAVIKPQDIDAVKIREGKTMVTLVTCHPYGQNNHRFVVFCEEIKEGETRAGDESVGADSGRQPAGEHTAALAEAEKRARMRRSAEKILPLAAIPLILLAVRLLIKGKR